MELESERPRRMQALPREMVHASIEWLKESAVIDGPTQEQVKDWEDGCDEILR